MADHDSGQVLEYLLTLRRRWRIVVAVTLAVTGAAVAVSLSADKQYDATTRLVLRQEPVDTLLPPSTSSNPSDAARQRTTDVELIKLGPTASMVRRRLGIARSAHDLLDQIDVDSSSESNIVALRARDRDPLTAARIANTFANAYVDYRAAMARGRYVRAARLAQRQLEAMSPQQRATPQGRELAARQRELQLTAALQTGGVEIIRAATVPTHPSRPRPKLSAALGLVLGLVLGLTAAFARELVDRRFRREEEVEAFVELPLLAAIARPSRRMGDLDQREAYGLLAANLRLYATDKTGPVVLMVTSADSREGKTTVTLGLARACARLGLRVIAVEADLRRPTFDQYSDLRGTRGLAGVLAGETTVGDELRHLEADAGPSDNGQGSSGGRVDLLAAGELPANAPEALSRPAMRAVLADARSLADVVLVDTAPVGVVNDAVGITAMVDQVLFVVQLGSTTKDQARRALRVLRNVAAPLRGVIITNTEPDDRSRYYTTQPAPIHVGAQRLS